MGKKRSGDDAHASNFKPYPVTPITACMRIGFVQYGCTILYCVPCLTPKEIGLKAFFYSARTYTRGHRVGVSSILLIVRSVS